MAKTDVLMELATCSVPEAGRALGLGRDASYEAARKGQIPVLNIGRFKRVPLPAFRRLLESGKMPEAADQ